MLKGKNHYALDATETSLGTVRSLEYFVQNMEDRLAHEQSELADAEKKCGELETKIGQPFEHEAKLQSLGGGKRNWRRLWTSPKIRRQIRWRRKKPNSRVDRKPKSNPSKPA